MKKKIIFLSILILGISNNICIADIYYVINIDTTVTNPAPIEGINYYLLDINNDQVIDYKIGSRFFSSNEGSHPPYDSYEILVWGTGENTFSSGPFSENDTINHLNSYESSDVLLGHIPEYGSIGAWAVDPEYFDSYLYVGIKLKKDNQFYYGWLKIKTTGNSFTIKSYAINEEAGQPIVAIEPN